MPIVVQECKYSDRIYNLMDSMNTGYSEVRTEGKITCTGFVYIRGFIHKFPNWPSGARTANGTDLCYYVQFYLYFVSQSSEFCRHSLLCCFSISVYFFISLPTQSGNFWIHLRTY